MRESWVSHLEARSASYLNNDLQLSGAERDELASLISWLPEVIVDAHVHTSRARELLSPLPVTLERHMMSTYVDHGLESSRLRRRALGLPPTWSSIRFGHVYPTLDRRQVNNYLLKNSPPGDGVVGLGVLDDTDYTLRLINRPDVLGLKMYPTDVAASVIHVTDYYPEAWLQSLEQLRKPIVLHLPAPLPETIRQVSDIGERYPNLPIVLAHVGLNHIASDEAIRSLEQVRGLPNLLVDTARVDDAQILIAAIEILGDDRVIFGSDEPLDMLRSVAFMHPDLGKRIATDRSYHWTEKDEHAAFGHLARGRPISLISQLSSLRRAVAFTDAHASKVLADNAKRVFGLPGAAESERKAT